MKHEFKGFSLIELLTALAITMGIGTVVFQLFRQNEQVFRDQNLIIEMHQNARAAAWRIGDEIRLAGQGMPVYAARFDSAPEEAIAPILRSSTDTRIDFRAGLSNVESPIRSPLPIDCALGTLSTLTIEDGARFFSALGTTTPTGKFIYLWGPSTSSGWAWVRAELTGITSNSLTAIPRQASSSLVRFTQAPTASLEEVVSFQLSGPIIRRATAVDMTNMSSPTWSSANEIGRNFTSLVFTYYNNNNDVVTPGSLTDRLAITRVDIAVAVPPSDFLSNGTRPVYSVSLRTIPRNLRIR